MAQESGSGNWRRLPGPFSQGTPVSRRSSGSPLTLLRPLRGDVVRCRRRESGGPGHRGSLPGRACRTRTPFGGARPSVPHWPGAIWATKCGRIVSRATGSGFRFGSAMRSITRAASPLEPSARDRVPSGSPPIDPAHPPRPTVLLSLSDREATHTAGGASLPARSGTAAGGLTVRSVRHPNPLAERAIAHGSNGRGEGADDHAGRKPWLSTQTFSMASLRTRSIENLE